MKGPVNMCRAVLAVLVGACLSARAGFDDCDPLVDDGTANTPASCCPIKLFPGPFKQHHPGCRAKAPGDRECVDECLMESSGLLTADRRLDGGRLRSALRFGDKKSDANGDVDAALERCLLARAASPPARSQCQSGAAAFVRCFMREVFINCPSRIVNTMRSCSYLQMKVKRCPNIEVIL